MKVTVTGATGTLGRALVEELLARGDEVTVAVAGRGEGVRRVRRRVRALAWKDPKAGAAAHRGAGGPGRRDPPARRARRPALERRRQAEIRDSRVLSTRNLVAALKEADPRPSVLVSQSASGWYGPRGDERVDESEPAAGDFLARVCVEWEAEARGAEELGLRVALTRTGVVLSRVGRGAGEDAAALQGRGRRTGGRRRRSTCRGSTPTTWWARSCSRWTRPRRAGRSI